MPTAWCASPEGFSVWLLVLWILVDHRPEFWAVRQAWIVVVRHDHDGAAGVCGNTLRGRPQQCAGEPTETSGADDGQAGRVGFANHRVHRHPVNDFGSDIQIREVRLEPADPRVELIAQFIEQRALITGGS